MSSNRYYKFTDLGHSVLALPIHAEPLRVARAFAWVRGARLYGMIAAKPGTAGAIQSPADPKAWFILFVGHVRNGKIQWAVRCRTWPKWADVEPTEKEKGVISREATATHLADDHVVRVTGFPEGVLSGPGIPTVPTETMGVAA